NGRINLYPVVQLIDIMKDLSRLSDDLKTSGVHLDCGSLTFNCHCLESESKQLNSGDVGLQYSFFSSATVANSIRTPEERPLMKVKTKALVKNPYRVSKQKKESADQLENHNPKDTASPSPSKDTSSWPEDIPLLSKNVPSQLKDIPSPSKDMPSQHKDTWSPSKDIPSQLKDMLSPFSTKVIISQPKDILSPSKDVPPQPEDASSPSKNIPSQPEDTSSPSRVMHLQPKDTSTPSKDIHSQHTLSTSPLKDMLSLPKDTPSPSKNIPSQLKGTSLPLKSTPFKEKLSKDKLLKAKPSPSKDALRERTSISKITRSPSKNNPPPSKNLPSPSNVCEELKKLEQNSQIASESKIYPRKKRKGKCIGIRRLVVKVAKIPVFVGKRHKTTYKVSSFSSASGGGYEASASTVDSIALLKMKDNGKNVTVMFPPGEPPFILKRKRGRPPKNLLMVQQKTKEKEPTHEVKRRRRRLKLPSPHPSYIADINDTKTDYTDVLSKFAFLNKQNQTFARLSPPRCWTPSEPDSINQAPDTYNISHVLHRVQNFRRRGGKAGCRGRKGVSHSNATFKCSFSDFFEGVGKKRKALVKSSFPRKRCKPDAETKDKPVRKRRRRNGALSADQGQGLTGGSSEWAAENEGSSAASRENAQHQSTKSCSHQGVPSKPFMASVCESDSAARAGYYLENNLTQTHVSQDRLGSFTGYFRSLLDSDDSSDLLDFSLNTTRPDSSKVSGGYTAHGTMQTQRWATPYQSRCPKISPTNCDNSSQSAAQNRQPYLHNNIMNYGVSQTSSDCQATESFQKLVPPSSVSRSPTSHQPSSSYAQYNNYNTAQLLSSSNMFQQSKQYAAHEGQSNKDCSFSYNSSNSIPSSLCSAQNVGYGQHTTLSDLSSTKSPYFGNIGSGHFSSASHIRSDSLSSSVSPGSYMLQKNAGLFQSSAEGCRTFSGTSQWALRPSYNNSGWNQEGFNQHYNAGFDFNINEPNIILDISNYTPQKVKQRSISDTFSESSTDSTQFNQPVGYKRANSEASSSEGQSSLSSLEKLMMDWNETTSGPGYNWNQNVLFQSNPKPGRGRKKKVDMFDTSHLNFSSSPVFATKRNSTPRQQRSPRGSCISSKKERTIGKSKFSQKSQPANLLYQASTDLGLDYYSGDSSMSPLPSQSRNFHLNEKEQCGYSSPYSVNPSTPSDESFPQSFQSDTASISPSITQTDLETKHFQTHSRHLTTPKHQQSFDQHHQKAFSPNCSPTLGFREDLHASEVRKFPACETLKHATQGSSISQVHMASRDLHTSHLRYDSPTCKNANYWYSQGSATSSPSYDKRGAAMLLDMMERTDTPCLSPQVISPSVSVKTNKEALDLGRGHSASYGCPVSSELNASPVPTDSMPYMQDNYRYPSLQTHGHHVMPAHSKSQYFGQILDLHSEDAFTVTPL
uniref:AT-hook DNA binding motif containing 1 n=1 Tax=Latimeria chalumnae TaxID=7897 RepID=H3B9Q8_LATCH